MKTIPDSFAIFHHSFMLLIVACNVAVSTVCLVLNKD